MKIETVKADKKNGKYTLLFKESDEVFANLVRRLIMEEVPTLAVEDIEIKDNNSALFDEMLGLRLGLAPIKTDLKSYELKENCKCEGAGCARCELKISLKASKKGYVFAEEATSTDPKCTFVYPKMILSKLIAKQKIDLLMTAILGKGKEHTKWSPGIAFYKRETNVKVGNVKDAKLIMDSCTDDVFELKSGKLSVNDDKVPFSHLLDFYTELDPAITLEETNNIVFHVESWGQLSIKEMLGSASEILINKVEELETQL